VFVAEDKIRGDNIFTTVGGLRDAWKLEAAPSSRDYIAKYTHPIATGTFNRCYAYHLDDAHRAATFSYVAPDAPPHGATFRKTVTIATNGSFIVSLDARFASASAQRARELTSLAIDPSTKIVRLSNALGFFEQSKQRLVAVYWAAADVEAATVDRHQADALVTLTYASGGTRSTHYAVASVKSFGQAQADLRALANRP
jgi:hypothetical protein